MSILSAGTRDVKLLFFLITYITITSEYEYAAASRQAVRQPTTGYGKHLTSATRHLLQNADTPALNDDGGVTMESKLVTRLSLLTAPANSMHVLRSMLLLAEELVPITVRRPVCML